MAEGLAKDDPVQPRAAWPVPTYALYGETREDPALGLLHCESIPERSARHDWEIRPHRHDALFQLLYLRGGSGEAEIEGRSEALAAGSLVVLPPLTVHGFRFSQDVDGWVVTLPEVTLRDVLRAAPQLLPHLGTPRLIRLPSTEAAFADLDLAFQRLAAEFRRTAPGRTGALSAWLALVLVGVGRHILSNEQRALSVHSRKLRHIETFRAAIERTYRAPRPIRAYASDLGITPTQLNRLCREVLGKSALELVHDRILLEAKRDLIYTTLSVNEIAYSLGFREPAYFSRFFKKRTGRTPSLFRRANSGGPKGGQER